MITNPGQPLDHRGHARKRPEIGHEAVGPAASAKRLLDGTKLTTVQLRLATRPPGTAQGVRAAAPPFPIPAADTLATDVQLARHGGQNQSPGGKQASCLLAPTLQFMEISSRRKRCVHGHSIATMQAIVTLLCEIQ
jgi:hypothetical protein